MYNIYQLFRSSALNCRTITAKLPVLLLLVIVFDVQTQPSIDHVENQLIVKFKEGNLQSNIVTMRANLNASVIKKLQIIDAELWEISNVTVDEAVNLYKSDPQIEYIEPNYLVSVINAIPNDPNVSQLWGLDNTGQTGGMLDADIDAPEAWEIQTGTDVLVGVIDTGVDWLHEDLAENIWKNPGEIPDNGVDDDGNGYVDDVRGWDFINGDNDPMDDNGHGTHVSGTIAAVGNNGIGVVGVCWSAKIIPLKFLGSSGGGAVSNAILAIEYATMMGAKLTSNSWGGDAFSQALLDAIAASEAAGMLFMAACGNDGINNDVLHHYPSDYELDNIISIAATTHNDAKSSFSNFGLTSVDLGAPGSNIYSTIRGNRYASLSGTSMATPHVAGVAALIWSQNPGMTGSEIKQRIMNSVDPNQALEGRTVTGGRLNAFYALAGPDTIPPNAVTDLVTTSSTSNSITLAWTASGDDNPSRMAASYDIRYALFPINEANFESANTVQGEPKPHENGSAESYTVTGLDVNTTYHFALKVLDRWGNQSTVSNSPTGTTSGPPNITLIRGDIVETLPIGATATRPFTISNTGEGTLSFDISIDGTGNSSANLSKSIELNNMGERNVDWMLQILRANEQVAQSILPLAIENANNVSSVISQVGAEEILAKRQQSFSSITETIYAVVLDGIGTTARSSFLWDELNASWSAYGDKEILIDYSTFHAIDITYEALAENGADVIIITNNWNPMHEYGPFSPTEAMAIAQYVNEGAGLYISGGTFNNGGFPELQPHVDFLAPLVGLSVSETYFWGNDTYGSAINFEVPEHPILRNIFEPYASGWQDETLIPHNGTWTAGVITTGTLVGISDNSKTALIVNGNRIFHTGLPEHESGTNSDKQFLYNVITQTVGWLSLEPFKGTIYAGNNIDISANFDATDLNSGDYELNMVIFSNDPDDSPLTVPVTLTVSDGSPTDELNLSWSEPQLNNAPGARDTLYVFINDLTSQNIVSYQMVVTFDENVLDAVGAISNGTVSKTFGEPTVNSDIGGEITIGGFGTQPLSGSGKFIGLIFDVIGNPGDATDLCIQSVSFNSGEPAVAIPNPCSSFQVMGSGNLFIEGSVTYDITDSPVPNVTLGLSGGMSTNLSTDQNGKYQFGKLQGGLNYTVVPSKSGDFEDDCVTCFDAALTAKHSVGLISFTPEQQKAADVDEDGYIFAFDAALICRYAVGLPPLNEKQQTGQWRFDPRRRTYTALSENATEQFYGATLLGDVDGNWITPTTAKRVAISRHANHCDKIVNPGEIISLPLEIENGVSLFSIDMELEYDSAVLNFLGVTKTGLSENLELFSNSKNGRLKVGAFATEPVKEGGTLLLLQFEVIGEEKSQTFLTFKRYQLNGNPAKRSVTKVIVDSSSKFPTQFALSQNYPNPFNPSTTIRFDIPKVDGEKLKTHLSIYNANGKLVRILLDEERPPGSYEIQWDGRNETGQPIASGIYLYKLVVGEFIASKKMIFLK